MIQDASCLLTKKQLLSHRKQSGVLFQLTFILSSLLQVNLLMNVITSLASLYTSVVKLIIVKVLRSYLQAHLDLQTMHNVIYLGMIKCITMGFGTIFITYIDRMDEYWIL